MVGFKSGSEWQPSELPSRQPPQYQQAPDLNLTSTDKSKTFAVRRLKSARLEAKAGDMFSPLRGSRLNMLQTKGRAHAMVSEPLAILWPARSSAAGPDAETADAPALGQGRDAAAPHSSGSAAEPSHRKRQNKANNGAARAQESLRKRKESRRTRSTSQKPLRPAELLLRPADQGGGGGAGRKSSVGAPCNRRACGGGRKSSVGAPCNIARALLAPLPRERVLRLQARAWARGAGWWSGW